MGTSSKLLAKSKLLKKLKNPSVTNVLWSCACFFFVGFLLGGSGPKPGKRVLHNDVSIKSAADQQQQNQHKEQLHYQEEQQQRHLRQQQHELMQRKEQQRREALTKSLESKIMAHGETGDGSLTVAPFQLLSWKPRAYIFSGFANSSICDAIVARAKLSLEPSGLALKEGDKPEDQKDVRTSKGTFLSAADDPTGSLAWVEKQMARVTALPVEHGEAFNVLQYLPGQRYQAHMDTFDPKDFGPQRTNRMASFLLYLTDVEEGGETIFPHEGGKLPADYDPAACMGLKVKPRKGDALLFWSMTPQRTIDENSLHASCPVIKGEKWVATKWIRDGL